MFFAFMKITPRQRKKEMLRKMKMKQRTRCKKRRMYHRSRCFPSFIHNRPIRRTEERTRFHMNSSRNKKTWMIKVFS